MASLALVGTVLAPLASANAGSLETEFDQAFVAPARPQLQAPIKSQPNLQPKTGSAQRALPSTVQLFAAPPAQRFYGTGLEAQLAPLTDSSNGRIGIAAIDLTSGRIVTVLGDTPFPMASTSKIAIAATFLDGVDHGRLNLSDSYPLMVPVKSKKYSSSVAPVRAGAMLTGQKLIEASLIHSNNQATDALLAAVGGPAAVNRWLRAAAITGLRLDRDIATLVRDDGEYDPARVIDQRDSTTPRGMAQLLSGIYQGRWLSPSSRSFLLATMERCETGKHRMRALLPGDARIAHKTGTLSNTSSDVGLIQTSDGRVYAVAIYVTGQGGHSGRDSKIAQIAQTIYYGYQGGSSDYRVAAQK